MSQLKCIIKHVHTHSLIKFRELSTIMDFGRGLLFHLHVLLSVSLSVWIPSPSHSHPHTLHTLTPSQPSPVGQSKLVYDQLGPSPPPASPTHLHDPAPYAPSNESPPPLLPPTNHEQSWGDASELVADWMAPSKVHPYLDKESEVGGGGGGGGGGREEGGPEGNRGIERDPNSRPDDVVVDGETAAVSLVQSLYNRSLFYLATLGSVSIFTIPAPTTCIWQGAEELKTNSLLFHVTARSALLPIADFAGAPCMTLQLFVVTSLWMVVPL